MFGVFLMHKINHITCKGIHSQGVLQYKDRFLRLIACSLIVVLQNSCALLELRAQISDLSKLHYFHGEIKADPPEKGPLIVILFAKDVEKPKILSYDIMPSSGAYELVAVPRNFATLHVLAFEDANRNFKYDEQERLAYVAPDPIVTAHYRITLHDIRLSVNSPQPPEFVIDLSPSGLAAPIFSMTCCAAPIGTITTLDNTIFSRKEGESGLWRPFDFISHTRAGIYFLEPYSNDKIPVLFVHGAGGTPADWRSIINDLDRKKFQPWVAYYPSGMRLEFSVWLIDQAIEELQMRLGINRLHVVAHSVGGLVVREFINRRIETSRPIPVAHFISISTPWNGHFGAALGVSHSPAIVPFWRDIVPNSPFIEKLFRLVWPASIDYSLLFGYGDDTVLINGANDGVVTLDSMLTFPAQMRAKFVYGFSENHVSILQSSLLHEVISEVLRN